MHGNICYEVFMHTFFADSMRSFTDWLFIMAIIARQLVRGFDFQK